MSKLKYFRPRRKPNVDSTTQIYIAYLDRICHTETLLHSINKFYVSLIALWTVGGWGLISFKLNNIHGFHTEVLKKEALESGFFYLFLFNALIAFIWGITAYGLTVRHEKQLRIAKDFSKALPTNPIYREEVQFGKAGKFAGHHMTYVLPLIVVILMGWLAFFTVLYGVLREFG